MKRFKKKFLNITLCIGGMEVKSKIAKINIPEKYFFSLFNSPYFSHKNMQAVDIYPRLRFGDIVKSPVSGKIEKIKKVKSPKGKEEYCIIVKKGDVFFKILHVKPIVNEGDLITESEDLGFLLSSGFFFPWTDPHIHIEIRKDDNIRAKGSERLWCKIKNKNKSSEQIIFCNNYLLIRKDIPCFVGDKKCILDGGLPYYGHGGVFCDNEIEIGEDVYIGDKKIGVIKKTYGKIATFKPYNFRTFLNDIEFKGISFYLNYEFFKLVPKREIKIKIWDEISINLRESSKTENL